MYGTEGSTLTFVNLLPKRAIEIVAQPKSIRGLTGIWCKPFGIMDKLMKIRFQIRASPSLCEIRQKPHCLSKQRQVAFLLSLFERINTNQFGVACQPGFCKVCATYKEQPFIS